LLHTIQKRELQGAIEKKKISKGNHSPINKREKDRKERKKNKRTGEKQQTAT
jgi:hypothetical protein